ncbi:MAG: hypothetical protein RLN90_11245 [Balneolaceae bacterium]
MYRFFILFLFGFSIVFLNCKSSPTSSQNEDEPIENPDGDGDTETDDGEDDESEPIIIQMPNDYSAFYPYQSLLYYNEDFDLEDYGLEFIWGQDSVDNDYDMYKRFDLVYYQDTLAVGDTLTAKVKEWGQWAVTIPRIAAGNYNFTVYIKDDLLLKGQVEILPIQSIGDPVNYIQTEFLKFKDQMSLVKADAEKAIQEVPYNRDGNDENFVEQMNKALKLYNELELKIFNDIQTASPEAMENLAYFMKAYEEILNEEYESFDDVLAKANDDPLEEPESAFENGKKWLTNKINFQGILNTFWDSDTENVEVEEGDLVETAKTWTVYGQAISIITGIQERFTKVFMLTTDKLEAELKGDFSNNNNSGSNKRKKHYSPYRDSLYFEYNQPIRISFNGEYENLRENPFDEAPWPNQPTLNVITNELYELIDDIGVGVLFGDLGIFPIMRQDTTNFTTIVNSKYLEFKESESTTNQPFFEVFDVEKDESSGEFIITAKPLIDDQGNMFYGEQKAETWLQYYQNEEYEEFDFMFFASNCPDFSLFMNGQWQQRYYSDDSRTELSQINRQTYFKDGTWTEKEYNIIANGSEWQESTDTGRWVGRCEGGEAELIWYHDFFTNIAYVYKYEKDKEQMFGYCSGLCNNGYNLELKKGW